MPNIDMNRANILTFSLWIVLFILCLVNVFTIVTANRDECSKLEEQAKIDRQKYQLMREQYQQKIKEYEHTQKNVEKSIQLTTDIMNQLRRENGLKPCKVQNGAMVCPEK